MGKADMWSWTYLGSESSSGSCQLVIWKSSPSFYQFLMKFSVRKLPCFVLFLRCEKSCPGKRLRSFLHRYGRQLEGGAVVFATSYTPHLYPTCGAWSHCTYPQELCSYGGLTTGPMLRLCENTKSEIMIMTNTECLMCARHCSEQYTCGSTQFLIIKQNKKQKTKTSFQVKKSSARVK